MIQVDAYKLSTPSPSDFKIAPGAKTVQADETNYCEHCSHCEENTILVCGSCHEALPDQPDEPLHCEGCLLSYDNYQHQARYIDPAAHACLAKFWEGVSEVSREGWCYLPEGHDSHHYFLKKADVQ